MTDDELIAKAVRMGSVDTEAEWQRLIALAKRGAATKWVPAKMARSYDPANVIAIRRWPDIAVTDLHHVHLIAGCDNEFTHYIPLSALGVPEKE